jgi:hypothetical protein
MLHKWFCIVAMTLLAVPAVSMAQFDGGDWELTLTGNGASNNDFDANSFGGSVGIGYFFTDNLEAAVRQNLTWTDAEDIDDIWTGATRVAADWHFDLDRWQPFIGATFGYIYGDLVDETFVAGPEAGVKWFANSTTFIYGMVAYDFFFEDSDDADDAFDDGQYLYSLGIGFKW